MKSNIRVCKTFLLTAILSCLVTFNSHATSISPDANNLLKKELSQKLHFDLNNFDLQDNRAFVRASFSVNEAGTIEVQDMNYSNEELKNELVKQLDKITVEQDIEVGKVYYCNFTFKMD